MAKNILVTGGAGYIGSHTVLQLLRGGFKTVVVDNLDNSSQIAIQRVKELAGDFGKNLSFHKVLAGDFWVHILWFCSESFVLEVTHSSIWQKEKKKFSYDFEFLG